MTYPQPTFGPDQLARDTAAVNGVELHYAHAGNGPLILFLHGFPQYWYQYRNQLAEFSQDHLAVAPDLRGYNLSSKPDDVHAYLTCQLVEDIRQLVEQLGYEQLVLVGHDVGGAVAWSFALHHPQMLSALVILDTPHPALFDDALRNDPEQQQASAYMLTARRPDAATIIASDDFLALRKSLDEPFISEQDLEHYVQSWEQPARWRARCAGFTPRARGRRHPTAHSPTATSPGTSRRRPSPCQRSCCTQPPTAGSARHRTRASSASCPT